MDEEYSLNHFYSPFVILCGIYRTVVLSVYVYKYILCFFLFHVINKTFFIFNSNLTHLVYFVNNLTNYKSLNIFLTFC